MGIKDYFRVPSREGIQIGIAGSLSAVGLEQILEFSSNMTIVKQVFLNRMGEVTPNIIEQANHFASDIVSRGPLYYGAGLVLVAGFIAGEAISQLIHKKELIQNYEELDKSTIKLH